MGSRCRVMFGVLGPLCAGLLCALSVHANSGMRFVPRAASLYPTVPILTPPQAPSTGSGPITTGGCTLDPDCDDSNDCTIDQCIDTVCVYTDEPDDTPCPDGVFCNGDETCQTGVCTDEVDPCIDGPHCDETNDVCLECVDAAECDDTNDCTLDECVANACVNTAVADDTPCPDGVFCNGDETCQAGVCTDQADPCVDGPHCDETNDVCLECVDAAECDDANDCTLDECIANACVNTAVADDTPCPDGLFCNGDETCQTGVCTDQVDPCIDGPHCDETNDVCLECVDAAECDDTNDCTLDECIANACVNTAVADDTPCPDGLFCNGDETCQTGVCTDQVDPCIDDPHCDETNDVCLECVDATECDDANDCTLDECIANACVNTAVADDTPCPDGVFCNGDETCQTGVCTDQADPCVDGPHCDETNDVCLECVDATECNDANDCTLDECIANACVNTAVADDTPCPDGVFCNGDETCQTGVCTAPFEPCVDADHCDEDADVCIACVFEGDCPIVINEIHYHPDPVNDPTEAVEFIELHNAAADPVDLEGWSLTEFADPPFVFPAGTVLEAEGYVVIARDTVALEAATGFATPHQWPAPGRLSNGGEPIALLDAGRAEVDRVEYRDRSPWPVEPDGGGPSLELTNHRYANDVAQAWRASVGANGTPGVANSAFTESPIVIAEDPPRDSVVGELPSISIRFAKSVVFVAADDLTVNDTPATSVTGTGAGPYVFSGFDPPAAGELISVVVGAGVIQDTEGHAFSGEAWAYLPAPPFVVINEIHYHPADEAVEEGEDPEALQFLELINDDSIAADLTGWTISDGVTFAFPDATVIEPGAFLVIAKNAQFLSDKGVFTGALQWTSGNLSNSGEGVAISDRFATVVDGLAYDDGGSWPETADGGGPSLELINPRLPKEFGPAWRASIPVNGTPGATNSTFDPDPAPLLVQPIHVPAIPAALEPVTANVLVLTEDDVEPTVTLHYRRDEDPPVAYESIQMFDDGAHGDGTAGNKVFGASLPGLADGQRYDFYMTADDGTQVSTIPPGHDVPDPRGNPSQTFLCLFSDRANPGDFPLYHIITTEANRAAQETGSRTKDEYDTTFIDNEGNIFYNVLERYRGNSSIDHNPPNFRVNFHTDDPLLSELECTPGSGRIDVVALQLMALNTARQWLGYDFFRSLGEPAPLYQFVRVVKVPTRHGLTDDWIYINVERISGRFLEGCGRFPGSGDNGNVYRGRRNAELGWRGNDPDAYRIDPDGEGYQKVNNEDRDEWTDLITLCDALNNTTDEEFPPTVAALVDEDNWARWFAGHMVLGNREGGIYRDTGDDYFLYFHADPGNPEATFLPWDMDSILLARSDETIWRTSTPAPRRFLRHNAFAPIFVTGIVDMLDNQFSQQAMDARIDAIPDAVIALSESPTRVSLKASVAARRTSIIAEIVRDFTIDPVPDPYEDPDPVLPLAGRLDQAGTHHVTVNGKPTTFSVFDALWSRTETLLRGPNPFVVRSFDRAGGEKGRIETLVRYDPPPAEIRLVAPTRMVNDKVLTVRAELLDPAGEIDWRIFEQVAALTAVRVDDQTDVPITVTAFDTHDGDPPADSIRFVSGVGSVSFTLDNGAAEPPGDIEITVAYRGTSASRVVTVLSDPPRLELSGTLVGDQLDWGPPDGVIHLTGNVVVPAGETLTIRPGTLVMVDAGPPADGTSITVLGSIQAVGRDDNSIYFFAAQGPSAMTLPVVCECDGGTRHNPASWRGILHDGTGSSRYESVILTGAGNGPTEGRTRPPIMRLAGDHALTLRRCTIVDNPGKALRSVGGGSTIVDQSLISRVGHGLEFDGTGYDLLVQDSWFTGIGHGSELACEGQECAFDGDAINLAGQASPLIQRCIFTDIGGTAIGHQDATIAIEHSIIHNVREWAVRGEPDLGGDVRLLNTLLFDCRGGGISAGGAPSALSLTHCTVDTIRPIEDTECSTVSVAESIIWGTENTFDSCCGQASYCDLGSGLLDCGTGNFTADPLFLDPGAEGRVYRLHPDSPAASAGPDGGRIGWLGFPGECSSDAQCDDGSDCTTDSCIEAECRFALTPDCAGCAVDEECAIDNLFCNGGETCADGICTSPGDPCVDQGLLCDEVQDRCVECFTTDDCTDNLICNGEDTCDNGVCTTGAPLCGNTCEFCDESDQTCTWCIFDFNRDSTIGSADFGFFAGCFGACYAEQDECSAANFDQSPDGCVGSGDFAGLAGCFGLSCGECDNCPGPGRGLTGPSGFMGVDIEIIARRKPTAQPLADVVPESIDEVRVGDVFYFEIWSAMRDTQLDADGLAAVYLDVRYGQERVQFIEAATDPLFRVLARGQHDPEEGTIHELGGCVLGERKLGVSPRWARVASIKVRAVRTGEIVAETSETGGPLGVSVVGRFGNLANNAVRHGHRPVRIVDPHDPSKLR